MKMVIEVELTVKIEGDQTNVDEIFLAVQKAMRQTSATVARVVR